MYGYNACIIKKLTNLKMSLEGDKHIKVKATYIHVLYNNAQQLHTCVDTQNNHLLVIALMYIYVREPIHVQKSKPTNPDINFRDSMLQNLHSYDSSLFGLLKPPAHLVSQHRIDGLLAEAPNCILLLFFTRKMI